MTSVRAAGSDGSVDERGSDTSVNGVASGKHTELRTNRVDANYEAIK